MESNKEKYLHMLYLFSIATNLKLNLDIQQEHHSEENTVSCNNFCFTPEGLCRINLKININTNETYWIVSEPVSFTALSFPHIPVYSPDKFLKTIELLCIIFQNNSDSQSPLNSITQSLRQSILQNNAKNAKELLHQSMNLILHETGTNFTKTKSMTLELIINILQIIENHNYIVARYMRITELIQKLVVADSISTLNTLLNEIEHFFIKNIFDEHVLQHSRLINKAIIYLHQNYQTKITQTQVANKIYISPTYFSRIFNEITGKSFSQYLNEIRINKAKELILNPDISVDAVFRLVGYNNQTYFNRIFKKEYNLTPKQYRCKYLGNF